MLLTVEQFKKNEQSIIKLLKSDLPIVLSYRLSKFNEALVLELNKVEELRKQLVIRFGDKQEDGTIKVKEDFKEDFIKEYNELMLMEINIDFDPLKVSDLVNYNKKLELMGNMPIAISTLDLVNLVSLGILI